MRKVKQTITYKVPSWNFCNLDVFTTNGRFSKETCRFCIKSKEGYRCALYDEVLHSDPSFVHKTKRCIDVTAGFAAEELPDVLTVDPKVIIAETLKQYKKIYGDLLKQGYPVGMAETVATKAMLGN